MRQQINNCNVSKIKEMLSRDSQPVDIVPSMHVKTHFKAATSVFLGHQGSLEDKDKTVEKILNDFSVQEEPVVNY